MHSDSLAEAIEPLIADGFIESVLYPVKSGKEATLYCCTTGYRLAADLVAVKVFKPQRFRSFRDDSVYQSGRVILNARSARAAAKRTRFGREVKASLWTGSEFETLRTLHRAGARVPRPLRRTDGAIAMEWIGDESGPAPQLKDVHLDKTSAQECFDLLLADVELWLACNIVHGDLSAYNVLYQSGRLVTIDFPQASDPRFNPHAPSLLARDVSHICQHFNRYGVSADANGITDSLWERYVRGTL